MKMNDGIAYLLATWEGKQHHVLRYTEAELAEMFTAAELEILASGRPVVKVTGGTSMRFADMLGPALAAAAAE